ncbi:MAG: polyphosphate kinase 1, partial [Bacteroidota bacterium]
RFFEEAANDPNVTSIKITQYRVAERSRIMEALIKAAKSGKEVMAFVEIKARFDEETNLRWAQQLKEAGAKVLFSQPGVKVHAKIAIVTRKEGNTSRDYCYLSTGNFNEKTARIYVDLGLLTADTAFAKDIQQLFNSLNNRKSTFNYRKLLVGQANLQSTLHKFIDAEIARAERGEDAYILLKVNSIEDQSFIQHLYKASQAGVKIDLIVRGICAVKAGVKGLSETINIISVIDRFLEHHRVYWFGNGAKPLLYLASADWMTRNLQHRIETAFPIENDNLRTIIFHLINLQLRDNCKARILTPSFKNQYRTDDELLLRSQLETYKYLQSL